jgi:aldose 1-epimerase
MILKTERFLFIMICCFSGLYSCHQQDQMEIKLIDSKGFDEVVGDKVVKLFTLKNANGLKAQITNYGGRVVTLYVPDKSGRRDDIVLGFDDLRQYQTSKEKYFGSLIGRYGNRIGRATFNLDGVDYVLAANTGVNHLHGGVKGFESVVWEAQLIDESTLQLNYFSKHLEEGYPGNLSVRVVYQLTDDQSLKVAYFATTDQPTVINLTHHSFFNLKGAGVGTINDHYLQINADYFTPVDDALITTGEQRSVNNTPFDFLKLTQIGDRLDQLDEQLDKGRGYDHNFVLNHSDSTINFAAKVFEPLSGRTMEVYTNEPGIQFYGGNFLDGSVEGKQEKKYPFRGAFCLETQHFPDSPNKPNFPSTLLKPGDDYYSICIYKFGIQLP